MKIKSSDIKPGDIIKFEYGDYGNWVTAVIDNVSIDPTSHSYCPRKLIWHYLSDEPKETQRDCRAEKRGNISAPRPYRQFTSYGNPNDIVEKLN